MTLPRFISVPRLVLGAVVAVAAAATFAPSPAQAWWARGGVVVGVPFVVAPRVYVAPPIAYVPPPVVYGPPVAVYPRPYARWIPGHYDYRGFWVRGHYA
jgi:hypothetical protein